MAPNGDDSNPGTQAAPRRTLLGASRLLGPGDVLYVRGGTYNDPGGYNWAASGTAAAPIRVRAYSGETPVFDGRLSVQQALILDGDNYVAFEGLTFTRYRPVENGVILVVKGSDHITFNRIRSHGHAGPSDTSHHFYLSGAAAVTIDACVVSGLPGAGVHVYGSASSGIAITNSQFNGVGKAALIGSGASSVRIAGNSISNAGFGFVFPSHGATNVRVTGNTIRAGVGIWVESLTASPIVEDHDDLYSVTPFRIGWPGESWSLSRWQSTGRGEGTVVH